MVCYHPLYGYRSKNRTKSGKRTFVFSSKKAYVDMPLVIPCGKCCGCRLSASRSWAVRCVHESSLYRDNCFITLTYNPENLPENNSLYISHFQKFMKRLRKKYSHKIRYYHCGEYGTLGNRPHYHACLFNHDFKDKILWQVKRGNKTYRSKELESLWMKGHSLIGDVTFESAAYVARYIMKKVMGVRKEEEYSRVDMDTGEIYYTKDPEYVSMSLKPGIGHDFYQKYKSDMYPSDEVILKGKKLQVPKYYDKLFDLTDHEIFAMVKQDREEQFKKHEADYIPERLAVRENCCKAKIKKLKRGYET